MASFCSWMSRFTRTAALTESSAKIPPGRPPKPPPPLAERAFSARARRVGEPGLSRSTAQIILPARHRLFANLVFKSKVSPSSYETLEVQPQLVM